jgi:hypothetical protein
MQLKYLCGALGAAFVVGLGKWLLWRRAASSEPAKLAGNGEAHK